MAPQIRHRTAATTKHGSTLAPNVSRPNSRSGINRSLIQRQHTKLHTDVWARIIGIVSLFTIFVLFISRIGKSSNDIFTNNEVVGSGSIRAGGLTKNDGGSNSLFVTVVMPSVVKPDARPRRLANIAKTWGPSSRAIYVVHSTDEYPEGSEIDEEGSTSGSSKSYPRNLLVPEHITVEQGVERLEHVIRTVHKDVNPDFAFFVNDHTFVLPNHLCQFLKEHDSAKDMYVGHALKGQGEGAFNSGAAGYVLSRSTIEKLIKEWNDPKSKCSAANASKWHQGNPGILTAYCFTQVLNIPVVDTRDESEDLSHRFHAYGIIRTVTGKVDVWYMKKHETLDDIFGVDTKYHHRPQHGSKCCSTNTISFHYVEAGESLAFWEVMQKVNQSPQMSDGEIKEIMNKVWPRDNEGLGVYSHGLPGPHLGVWDDIIRVVRKISNGVVTSSC
mmetsp:Transcript_18971/g.41332  ORF Transcript_18971/g.41332 Transcript_18971/m.41332 type:complete len:442 (-) Transcript_18971:16-1341(-)